MYGNKYFLEVITDNRQTHASVDLLAFVLNFHRKMPYLVPRLKSNIKYLVSFGQKFQKKEFLDTLVKLSK